MSRRPALHGLAAAALMALTLALYAGDVGFPKVADERHELERKCNCAAPSFE